MPRMLPVVNEASSESRKHTNLAISSGLPALVMSCIGAAMSSNTSSETPGPTRFVCTMPGATALTRVPCAAASMACNVHV
eukprot:11160-Heterococcus_DN1.PRE.5